MSPTIEQILRPALALPEQERTERIEELLASQSDAGALLFDPTCLSEIQRPSAEIDRGEVTLTPRAEVRNRARSTLE